MGVCHSRGRPNEGGGRTRHTLLHPPSATERSSKQKVLEKKKESASFTYIPRKLMLEKKKSIQKLFKDNKIHTTTTTTHHKNCLWNKTIFSSLPPLPLDLIKKHCLSKHTFTKVKIQLEIYILKKTIFATVSPFFDNYFESHCHWTKLNEEQVTTKNKLIYCYYYWRIVIETS